MPIFGHGNDPILIFFLYYRSTHIHPDNSEIIIINSENLQERTADRRTPKNDV